MKDIAYYNGKIGRIDEVQAPITDRGFTSATAFTMRRWSTTKENLRA